MEQNHQNASEEVKAGDGAFRSEDVNYPRCPLHRTDASLVPKNDEGWIKQSNHILKCLRSISIEKIDVTEFILLDQVFEEQTQDLNRINKQQPQNNFLGILGGWLKQLATLQDSIRGFTEYIHGFIKLHQGGQLTKKLGSYLEACITKYTPDYDSFVERLKTLKQHLLFDKANIKIVDDPAIFAKKVNRKDPLLQKMVKGMLSRVSKFRDGMSKVEPEDNNYEVRSGVYKAKTGVKDQQIDVEDSIEDKPESIVAYSLESKTKTFKYITVEGVKSKNYTQKSKTINHICEFPGFHFAPITRKGAIYLIGGHSDNHWNACWELDLKHSTMVEKQNMKNERWAFGGAVIQNKYIQVVAGRDDSSDMKSCERQDIAANTWQNVADCPVAVSGASCCSFDDKYIYSIGGQSNKVHSKDICVYDTKINTWSRVNVDSVSDCKITPGFFKIAIQINKRQIQVFGGSSNGTESCLLEVDEKDYNKIKVKESNRIKPSDVQRRANSQSNVIQQGKLQCSQGTGNWIYKINCFDSEKWQVLA